MFSVELLVNPPPLHLGTLHLVTDTAKPLMKPPKTHQEVVLNRGGLSQTHA